MKTGVALDTRDVVAVRPPLWRRRWIQNVGLAAIAILGAYALIYHDVVSRAHAAYLQGEMHMAWQANPMAKQIYFDNKLAAQKQKLDRQRAKGKISDDEYKRKTEAAEFDHDFALSESSVKYAYQWYKDAYELFSPPESKWTRMAREKAPQALALWKQELRAQNVPFEDTMFE
jgi:hypothetical protein